MTNHKYGASQHGPNLITLFTGNCQVETLFSSDIIIERNEAFLLFVEANPQQENNFVFLSPFHSIFVIYTPSMLSERVSVSSCSEKETMCFVTR